MRVAHSLRRKTRSGKQEFTPAYRFYESAWIKNSTMFMGYFIDKVIVFECPTALYYTKITTRTRTTILIAL